MSVCVGKARLRMRGISTFTYARLARLRMRGICAFMYMGFVRLCMCRISTFYVCWISAFTYARDLCVYDALDCHVYVCAGFVRVRMRWISAF